MVAFEIAFGFEFGFEFEFEFEFEFGFGFQFEVWDSDLGAVALSGLCGAPSSGPTNAITKGALANCWRWRKHTATQTQNPQTKQNSNAWLVWQQNYHQQNLFVPSHHMGAQQLPKACQRLGKLACHVLSPPRATTPHNALVPTIAHLNFINAINTLAALATGCCRLA